jgi:pimeloyl-ACP methyl ester carboxylesterase
MAVLPACDETSGAGSGSAGDGGSGSSASSGSNASSGSSAERTYTPEAGLHTVAANGINIAYAEAGKGPLVILLHGFPDTLHTWDAIVPKLSAAGFHAVTPSLRGYAPSGIPAEDTTFETMGRDVLALIKALGEEHAIVIGHDWGALAAYTAAALEPSRVDKLVTIAIPHPISLFKHLDVPPSPHFAELNQPDAEQKVKQDDFQYLDQLVVRWSPNWKVPAGELDPIKNTFLADGSLHAALGYYRAASSPMLPPELLQPLPMPALTFHGTEDTAGVPALFGDQASAFTGKFELVALPAGHFVHREAEDAFVAKLMAFLGS